MIDELLGFDIRLKSECYLNRVWDRERRFKYLLNPQTPWPLSVDIMVWPSMFRYTSTQAGSGHISLDKLIEVETINTRHDALSIWPSLREMDKCFDSQKSAKLSGVKIAIILHVDKKEFNKEHWRAVLSPALSINDIPDSWNLVGYDIADQDLTSGLSNCGYSVVELAALRNEWKNRINEYGLFDSFEDALSFRDLTAKRVPSHSPFYVYSILWDSERVKS